MWEWDLTPVLGLPELPCRAVQLYDTPYEEQDGEPGDRPFPGQRPGPSRQPPEDERPADEYDQPWEWKKDHISKAFAGAPPAQASMHLGPSMSCSVTSPCSAHRVDLNHPPLGGLLILTKV